MYVELPHGGDRIIRIRSLQAQEEIDESQPVLKEKKEPLNLLSKYWAYSVDEQEFATGQTLYVSHCQNCHGPEGQGSTDLSPLLASTDWITNDKAQLIRTILLGLSEPIEVNVKTYNQEMPAFQQLTDQEVADILSFVRNSFGNSASALIPGEVFEECRSLE